MKHEVNREHYSSLDIENDTNKNEPFLYQVFLHNDDYTPMEFVVSLLERFFYMDRKKAAETMLEAHLKGKATCGVYTREIAETKLSLVIDYAASHEHPLTCSMEAAA